MTSSPFQPHVGPDPQAAGVPAGDLGVGGPADDAGDPDLPQQPAGVPTEVDPAEGPLAGRSGSPLGDLRDPGAAPAD